MHWKWPRYKEVCGVFMKLHRPKGCRHGWNCPNTERAQGTTLSLSSKADRGIYSAAGVDHFFSSDHLWWWESKDTSEADAKDCGCHYQGKCGRLTHACSQNGEVSALAWWGFGSPEDPKTVSVPSLSGNHFRACVYCGFLLLFFFPSHCCKRGVQKAVGVGRGIICLQFPGL